MAYRHPPTPEQEEEMTASPEGTRILVIAYLTAVILGFACGVVWVSYQLFRHYFLG
jgi:hypothetical protein